MESNETNRFLEIDDNENDNYNIKDNISEKSKKSEQSKISEHSENSYKTLESNSSVHVNINTNVNNISLNDSVNDIYNNTLNNENIGLINSNSNQNLNNNDSLNHNNSFLTFNSNSDTKNTSGIYNNIGVLTHNNPEINEILDEVNKHIVKDINYLSNDELNIDIDDLKRISEKLMAFINTDNNLVVVINQIEDMIDNRRLQIVKDNKHFACYNKYVDKEPEMDSYGNYKMSKTFLNKMLCEKTTLYYRTHELNDILYLHFNGFREIENLETFINLKVLYIENNCIKKISGLSSLKSLTCLYLQENAIEVIENLEELTSLNTLNLSDNQIKKIENLSHNKRLSTLLLKRNKIGYGENDLDGLLELSSTVNVIDISDNKISDPDIIEKYLSKVEGLRVIYLSGNDCVRKIANYRKVMICKLKNLRYIDDKPVFEDEKRFAEAFGRGGIEEEKRDRERFRIEKSEENLKRIKDFQEMVSEWKNKEKKVEKEDTHKNNEKSENRMDKLLMMNNKLKEKKQKQNNENDEKQKGKLLMIDEEVENDLLEKNLELLEKKNNPNKFDSIDDTNINIEENTIKDVPDLEEINGESNLINNNSKVNFDEIPTSQKEKVMVNSHKSNVIFDDLD